MAKYISESALVAEIERRKQVAFGWMETAPNDAIEAEFELCDDILSFINTLEVKEVKEVDLEKEYLSIYWSNEKDLHPFLSHVAKHFFELGLKAAQKGEKV